MAASTGAYAQTPAADAEELPEDAIAMSENSPPEGRQAGDVGVSFQPVGRSSYAGRTGIFVSYSLTPEAQLEAAFGAGYDSLYGGLAGRYLILAERSWSPVVFAGLSLVDRDERKIVSTAASTATAGGKIGTETWLNAGTGASFLADLGFTFELDAVVGYRVASRAGETGSRWQFGIMPRLGYKF